MNNTSNPTLTQVQLRGEAATRFVCRVPRFVHGCGFKYSEREPGARALVGCGFAAAGGVQSNPICEWWGQCPCQLWPRPESERIAREFGATVTETQDVVPLRDAGEPGRGHTDVENPSLVGQIARSPHRRAGEPLVPVCDDCHERAHDERSFQRWISSRLL
jgi:hypothetical protein